LEEKVNIAVKLIENGFVGFSAVLWIKLTGD
jgi:hypothetical protein